MKPQQLTIENIQYGKPKEYKPKMFKMEETCKKSKIEPRQDLQQTDPIFMHQHAGTIAHLCWSVKGHSEEYCKCPCGHQWRAIGEPSNQRRIDNG